MQQLIWKLSFSEQTGMPDGRAMLIVQDSNTKHIFNIASCELSESSIGEAYEYLRDLMGPMHIEQGNSALGIAEYIWLELDALKAQLEQEACEHE